MSDASLDTIEARVAADRAALAHTLDRLSKATDVSAIEAEASALVDRYGSRAIDIARANPAAVALVGLGATMLVAGLGARPARPVRPVEPTAVPPGEAMEGFDARVRAADGELRSDATGETGMTAVRMRVALKDGLEKIPEPARRRIIDLRLKAIAAQEQIEAKARKATSATGRVLRRNPIQSAAIAIGLGAVAGALLPRTRLEDEHLGALRDHALRQAADAVARERSKIAANLKSAAQEARRAAGERAHS